MEHPARSFAATKPSEAVLRFRASPPNARARLFCFPHAGGGAYLYRTWPAELPDWLDVMAVELPGRGRRMREPLVSEISALVERLGPALLPLMSPPYALFGHSMGALLAFEVARWMKRHGQPQPRVLFASGRNPPQTPPGEPIHQLSDDELIARVLAYEGSSPEVFASPDLRSLFLPVLRADFAAVEGYRFQPQPLLDCAIEALTGTEDHRAPPGNSAGWAEVTTARTRTTSFPGGHFFLRSAEAAVTGHVARNLGAALAEAPVVPGQAGRP